MSKTTYWTLALKGGVGKSTLAVFINDLLSQNGRTPPLAIDLDVSPKLALFCKDAKRLNGGAKVDDLLADPKLIIAYWDKLRRHILTHDGDTLVDFGAGMAPVILNWATRSDIAGEFEELGIKHRIFIVVTTEPLAISKGLETLALAMKAFPAAEFVIVFNEMAGLFATYATNADYVKILQIAKSGKAKIVVMPRCNSEGWTILEKDAVSPLKAIEMSRQDLMAQYQLDRPVAIRTQGDIATWYKSMRTALEPILV